MKKKKLNHTGIVINNIIIKIKLYKNLNVIITKIYLYYTMLVNPQTDA